MEKLISSIKPNLSIFEVDPKEIETLTQKGSDTLTVIDENNKILKGHAIYYLARQTGEPTLEVVVKSELTEEEKGLLINSERVEAIAEDVLFPSDNEYGIPTLDMSLQADSVVAPCLKWGSISRRARPNVRTVHFYTDDYKFEALWRKPEQLANLNPRSVVEPNFSTGSVMPRALVLGAIFQKRWMARFWQSCGIRVFVDLNVQPRFYADNLLGVPKGWQSYATRYVNVLPDGTKAGDDWIERDYEVAKGHSDGNKPLFAVFGGRDKAEQLCARNGWLWIPEDSAVKRGEYRG
jgi:hypothetical protein